MKFSTWEVIAKRHVWYRALLVERMAEWPETRVDACTDLQRLQYVLKLSERVERHQARMDRHINRAMDQIPAEGKA